MLSVLLKTIEKSAFINRLFLYLHTLIGTYQPYSGQSNCTECEPGFYCLENSTQPTECPIYYYCPAGSAVGEFCPNGTFGNVSGLYHPNQCADCPTGSYCRDGQVTGENFCCKSVFYWGEAAKNVEIDVIYNFPHLMFCFAFLFDPFLWDTFCIAYYL